MMQSFILKTATRLLAGMILVFAIYLLFRGHNSPGGGFAGALVAGTGFALIAISDGAKTVRSAIRMDPRRMAMVGLMTAIVSGLIGVMAGEPFLTGLWWTPSSSGSPSSVAIGTPMFFDIGVFLTVLGTILTLVLALEEN